MMSLLAWDLQRHAVRPRLRNGALLQEHLISTIPLTEVKDNLKSNQPTSFGFRALKPY